MAIKTKKISELAVITNIDDNTSFLGISGGQTGQIKFETIFETIKTEISEIVEGSTSNIKTTVDDLEQKTTSSENDINNIKTAVGELEKNVSELITKGQNEAAVNVVTNTCDCAEKIAALEAKVAALEGFVQALQKDGYLTLKEIQRAAADACPICNHTHEEEQPTE